MRQHQRLNTYHQEIASRAATRKAQATPATKRKPLTEREAALAAAIRAYYAARNEAIANGTTLPNFADFEPKEVAA